MALAVPKCAPAAAATRERVAEVADALTSALAEVHGGKWHVTVDHDHQFVLIVGGAK